LIKDLYRRRAIHLTPEGMSLLAQKGKNSSLNYLEIVDTSYNRIENV